jgi:hypothetical protein
VNIFIDESGSFVRSEKRESWNAVVAVASAESARSTIASAVGQVRREAHGMPNEEIKLNNVDEEGYLRFLGSLRHTGLIVFAATTDAGLNTPDRVVRHQAMQVANIREAIPKMRFEGGRMGVKLLADQIESLSPQLYVQLICQINLLHDVVGRSINYFAQRIPATLREFRWRVDQKNTIKTTFEDAFEKIAPALLQTRSIHEPMEWVRGFNYGYLKAYEFEDGRAPDYLQTEYGLPEMEGLNVQKLIRRNLDFVDSKKSDGIQVADLLASGLRRLLRGAFADNASVARALAQLTLQNKRGKHPIILTSFSEVETPVSEHVASTVRILARGSRHMLARSRASDA